MSGGSNGCFAPAVVRAMDLSSSRRTAVLVAILAMVAHIPGILAYRPPLFYDDAMFFFRYAEHLAQGEGFRWNLGEPPVWGASAPLWPLLLAGLVRLGVGVGTAALVLAWAFSLSGAAALAVGALRVAGVSGAAWCILFEATSWRYCNNVLSGMESPLAMFLVSLGILALSGG
jgi:hypothetical protein